ncbi:MAG: riboflavin biosynthesis protein RibF [Desulfuromonas sp.]|nr:MAG: riboflavin biosynthesis protein RibF [Desulfuromonas sp.]
MKIAESLTEIASGVPSVVTLGNFDGVHLGHRELFRRTVQRARELCVQSVVYTFDPHPLKVLAPDRAPLLLNTPAEKVRLIEASEIDLLIQVPFDVQFASQPADAFVRDVLVSRLNVQHLVVGYDYAFGRDRLGTPDYLVEQGRRYGFTVEVLQPLGADGRPYSSTQIRELIAGGQVSEVVDLLGRHYTFEGRVVPGDQRGRQLGFPTANLVTDKEQLPAAGVYAVEVRSAGRAHAGVVNIGQRPTFGDGATTIEVHLLDFSEDLYGRTLRLYFFKRLRGEHRFAGPEQLRQAISADVLAARKVLDEHRVIPYWEYLSQEDQLSV